MPGLLLVDMFANSEVCLVYYWQTLFATRSLPIAPSLRVETPALGNLVTNLISFLKSVLNASVTVRYIQTQDNYKAEKCSKLLLLRG